MILTFPTLGYGVSSLDSRNVLATVKYSGMGRPLTHPVMSLLIFSLTGSEYLRRSFRWVSLSLSIPIALFDDSLLVAQAMSSSVTAICAPRF